MKTAKEIAKLALKQQFYTTLNERQRRQFAAIEANQLGHGGIKAVSESFSISPMTIRTALSELKANQPFPKHRVRKVGGGRKKSPD